MMQHLTLSLVLLVPLLALAAENTESKATMRKPPAMTSKSNASKLEIRDKAKGLAVASRTAEVALTPDELAIAGRVHVGHIPCELANAVHIQADPKTPGYFQVQVKSVAGANYRMTPVLTSTGAIRLEDTRQGAVWLQLANKSMLMNQKLGKRLADECMSPQQLVVAEGLRKSPAPSLLEPLPAPATPSAAAPDVPVQPASSTR